MLQSYGYSHVSCVTFLLPQDTIPNNKLFEVVTDAKSLSTLREMKLTELCPKIRRVRLDFPRDFSSHVISTSCLTFPRLTHLEIAGASDHWVSLDDSTSFCQKVRAFYPHLIRLAFTDLDMGNKMAADIVRSCKDLDSLKELM